MIGLVTIEGSAVDFDIDYMVSEQYALNLPSKLEILCALISFVAPVKITKSIFVQSASVLCIKLYATIICSTPAVPSLHMSLFSIKFLGTQYLHCCRLLPRLLVSESSIATILFSFYTMLLCFLVIPFFGFEVMNSSCLLINFLILAVIRATCHRMSILLPLASSSFCTEIIKALNHLPLQVVPKSMEATTCTQMRRRLRKLLNLHLQWTLFLPSLGMLRMAESSIFKSFLMFRLLRFAASEVLEQSLREMQDQFVVWFPLGIRTPSRIWYGAMKLALQAGYKYNFVDGSCIRESYSTTDVLTPQ
ncbi:hypothetical protein Tco_1370627 [Tanacetum coccineum]